MTFVIYQNNPDEEEIHLYPTSDVRWPSGTSNTFAMYYHHESSISDTYDGSNCTLVDDPYYFPDDELTYMFNDGSFGATEVLEFMDLFEVPDHTTEYGTIKNVKLLTRVRNANSATACDKVAPIIEIYNEPLNKLHGEEFQPTQTYTDYVSYMQSYLTLVLRPNGDGAASDWNPIGAANNYQCVDEATPDYATSMVTMTLAESIASDYYTLPNHTTETGTIRQITIYTVARKTVDADDAIFTIWLSNNAGGTGKAITDNCFFKYHYPTTSWVTYSTTFRYKTNNSAQYTDQWTWDDIDDLSINLIGIMRAGCTGEMQVTQIYAVVYYDKVWTWDDIDRMRIGIVTQGGRKSGIDYFIARPNAAGGSTQLSPYGETNNWECVDDEDSASNFDDYVYTTAGTQLDLYNFPNHTTETESIEEVSVINIIRHNHTSTITLARSSVTAGGSTYYGNALSIAPNQWYGIEGNWAVNPATAAPWTWAEIDRIQAGVELTHPPTGVYYDTTTILVVKYIRTGIKQDIHITQNYAAVTYYPIRNATFINPTDIESDHSNQINMWNHWSGNRTVFSLSRQHKTLTLSGLLYDYPGYDASVQIDSLMAMGKNGSTVTLGGLTCTNYNNHDYKIRSFGYKLKHNKPELYEYKLELEDAEKTT